MIKNIEKINEIKRTKVKKIAKYIKETDTKNIIDKVIGFGIVDYCIMQSVINEKATISSVE